MWILYMLFSIKWLGTLKYIKIKFNSDDDLPLKTLELYNMVIVVGCDTHEGKKYYPQIVLDECVYRL